jgi:hypothetical protein
MNSLGQHVGPRKMNNEPLCLISIIIITASIPGTGIEPLTTKICPKEAELGFFEGKKQLIRV